MRYRLLAFLSGTHPSGKHITKPGEVADIFTTPAATSPTMNNRERLLLIASPEVNIRLRFNELNELLEEMKYRYLTFSDYALGYYSIDASHLMHELPNEFAITFLRRISELARYYLTCIALAQQMEIPDKAQELDHFHGVYDAFRALILQENQLLDGSTEQQDTFMALNDATLQQLTPTIG